MFNGAKRVEAAARPAATKSVFKEEPGVGTFAILGCNSMSPDSLSFHLAMVEKDATTGRWNDVTLVRKDGARLTPEIHIRGDKLTQEKATVKLAPGRVFEITFAGYSEQLTPRTVPARDQYPAYTAANCVLSFTGLKKVGARGQARVRSILDSIDDGEQAAAVEAVLGS